MVYSCVLLAEKKISKEQKQEKKVWTKKRKEYNNNSKREEKRREMEHIRNTQKLYCLCCLFLVCVSIATFHTCFTPLIVTTGARNTYRTTTRTNALDIYSILLSVTDLCAIYKLFLFLCLPSSTYTSDQYRKRPCNLGDTPSHVS